MILHSSDLRAFGRCAHAWHLENEGFPRKQLSATAYGSVMHHALHVLERTGDLGKAEDTFRHYWHPAHIEAVCQPVDIWIGRDTYSSLLTKGVQALRRYYDLLPYNEGQLLALEYEFIVPVHNTVDHNTGQPHLLAGTVDRLALRSYKRKPTVSLEDYKTGAQPTYLRHHLQGTAYAYASTQKEFWTGWKQHHTDGFGEEKGTELYEQHTDSARRFWWINMTSFKWVDGGFRGDRDYERLRLAIQHVADAIAARIFPLHIEGEVCQYCTFRDVCGGGLDDGEGTP